MLKLDEMEVELLPGDRLVMYTDGMTDVTNTDGALFKREKFIDLLRRHAPSAPDDLCARVFADLADYQQSAAQYDDMTMLVLGVE